MTLIRTCLPLALALLLGAVPCLAAAQSSEDEAIMRKSGGTDTPPPAAQEEELSTTYSSIGLQKVAADFANVSDAVNLDITLIGFRIPTVSWFAVELNGSFTMIPGQVDPNAGTPDDPGTCIAPGVPSGCRPASQGTRARAQGDFAANSYGAYVVLRSPGKFFVTGKYGYRYLSTTIDQLQNDRSGNAYTAGVGYSWKRGSYAELGYTKLADAIDGIGFMVSYTYGKR